MIIIGVLTDIAVSRADHGAGEPAKRSFALSQAQGLARKHLSRLLSGGPVPMIMANSTFDLFENVERVEKAGLPWSQRTRIRHDWDCGLRCGFGTPKTRSALSS
jgi:hypothetical protein